MLEDVFINAHDVFLAAHDAHAAAWMYIEPHPCVFLVGLTSNREKKEKEKNAHILVTLRSLIFLVHCYRIEA